MIFKRSYRDGYRDGYAAGVAAMEAKVRPVNATLDRVVEKGKRALEDSDEALAEVRAACHGGVGWYGDTNPYGKGHFG